jgi:hypothetical protein
VESLGVARKVGLQAATTAAAIPAATARAGETFTRAL